MPVIDLEAFIAKYIKAISACGVITDGSCDGYQANQSHIRIISNNMPSIVWHNILWENFKINNYSVSTGSDAIDIFFSGDKYALYYDLLVMAERLYSNRIILRDIKQEVMQKILCWPINNMTNEAKVVEFCKLANLKIKKLIEDGIII